MAFKLGSQNNQLVRFLFHEGRAVSRLTAFTDLGVQNLTARIADLRRAGYIIGQVEDPDMRGKVITQYYGVRTPSQV